MNKFKEENNLEQNVKDLLVNRQKVHIDGLRNELKNAKIVMQNRKLRMKLYEKLDDYMKDHETTTSHKKTRSEMPSRNGSSRFKPSQTSKNYQRRSEASSPCQQVFAKKFVSASINVIDFTL